jgi:hypothetical protein
MGDARVRWRCIIAATGYAATEAAGPADDCDAVDEWHARSVVDADQRDPRDPVRRRR